MRFKDLLELFPAPRRAIKHAYSAITLTRYTTLYFAALLLSTITLASLELSSHVTNRHADVTVSTIMHLASVQSNLIPIVSNQDGQGVLQLCNGIPSGSQDERCQTVVAPTPVGTQTELPANVGSSPSTTRQSSSVESTTPAQVPQEAQAPVSTTTSSASASASSSSSTNNPGLFFVEQPTSTSSSSFSAFATGPVVAEVPDPTTSTLTTTSTRRSKSTTTIEPSNTATDAKATTQPSTETTTTTESDKGRTDTTSTSFSTIETTSSTSSQEPETQSNTQLETTQATTSEVLSTTTSSTKEKETETTSAVTLTTSSSSFESTTPTTSNDRTSTLPTSTSEPSSTFTSTSRDAGIADVTLSEPNLASLLPTAAPILQTSAVPETKAETTTSTESGSSSASATLSSDSTAASTSTSTSTSSERPTDETRRRTVLQDRMILRRSFKATPVTNSTTGAILGLNVTDISGNGSNDVTFVDVRCAQALVLVEEQLHESWTEDLVMVGYHIWLFGLGAMAILNESIPHLVAAFISSILALIWSGSQIAETRDFYNQFNTFITDGACDGADILPAYWSQRSKIDMAILVLNSISVLVLGGLGSKLISIYRRQMTKVVGEEKGVMRRLYKAVLLLSIVIQIGAFLLLASLALWVQQLFTSPIASFSSTTPAFKGVGLLSIFLTIPWFIIGWIAIRREHKILMVIFLVMNGLFLAGWVVVFSSDVYRLVFTKWTFFAAVTVATFFLLVGSLIAGVLCRMHFGMGLAVQLEEKAKDEVDVTPWEFSNTAENAWEPFERDSIRQSRFTATSSDRQSTTFSYGLKSPAPPVPPRRPTNLSRFSNLTN